MKTRLIAVSFLWLALAGCAQLVGLTGYSVSEADVQARLNKQLKHWSQDMSQEIGVNTDITQLKVTLSDEQARFDIRGEAALSQLLKNIPLSVAISVQGKPALEGHAIYLRNLKVLSAKADVMGYSGRLGPDSAMFSSWLTRYLDNHPIYRIPDDSPFAKMPLTMTVSKGKITFHKAN
ncbi:DUF1439 domain-containing protein [Gallaecimonas mangrovi]|uniref:DUF1439 domain-containing protein n=1 Tax=Gallaecimonas mangrovi TaxID=2291597 RepID=UPI00186888D1|nr:DUF1439 domain-containing protein [Gallaecimonas mangrovi]